MNFVFEEISSVEFKTSLATLIISSSIWANGILSSV